ncbi:MAG: hypothetical protein U1E73_00750 [Planctomycetota bacterium]
MTTSRGRRRAMKLVLAGVTTLGMLGLGEGVLRLVGGYRLFALRLTPAPRSSGAAAGALAAAHDLVDPFAARWRSARPDIDPDWLAESPPPLPPEPALGLPLLAQRDWLLNYYVLNEVALRTPLALKLATDPLLKLPEHFTVFTPPGGKPFPHYRYPASRSLPTGLVTNKFGFRGGEVAVDKPARTVRIALVGASTTAEAPQLPHDAPQLIQHWLGFWARREGLDVRFEVLNAAREAIRSHDIRAIVEDEVLPLAIDYLVYYEGANQFQPETLHRHIAVEGEYHIAVPPPGVVGTYDETAGVDATWLDGLSTWSATARYLRTALAGRARLSEPAKPAQHVTLPPELLQGEFPLDRAAGVLELQAIGGDLAAIKAMADAAGAKFVLSTFWWFAQDGMTLDPVLGKNVHVHLNRAYWPFRYAAVRQLADVQNRFFAAWAKANGIDLVDVGGELPQDERLAIDAIHHSELGVRLKAWIFFAALTRIVERDLAARRIPVPDTHPDDHHPNIGPTHTIAPAELGLRR